jgi:hypothetical protein
MLDLFLDSGRKAVPHNSMKPVFWIANAFERIRPRPDVMKDTFVDGKRNLTPIPVPDKPAPGQRLEPASIPVLLASTARAAFDTGSAYHPRNLAEYVDTHTPPIPSVDEEQVVGLPKAGRPAEQVAVPAPEAAQA